MPLRSSLPVLILVAACTEPVLSKTDDPPAVVIQQPDDGAVFAQGETVAFVGRVNDDGPLSQVEVTWLDNGRDPLAAVQTPDDDGFVGLNTADLAPGNHAVTLRAVDASGLSADVAVNLTVEAVDDTPTITVVHPTSGERGQQDASTLFEAAVADPQDAPTDLTVELSSDLDGFLCTLVADAQGEAVCRATLTTTGDHRLTFSVTDTDGHEAHRNVVFPVDPVTQEPLIQVVLPTSGSRLRQGVLASFEATVSDQQDAPTALLATVRSDRDGDVCVMAVDAGGGASCFGALTTLGAHFLTFEVVDPDDNVGTARIAVQVSDGTDIDDDGDGQTEQQGDCNDANASVYTGAAEQPNGADDNCNGVADEGTVRYDDDGDGYCESTTAPCTDGTLQGDCNDAASTVHPGATEVCANGVDDNCVNGEADIGAQGCTTWWFDGDNDTFGLAGDTRCLCSAAGLYRALNGNDCDDTQASVFPGATELPNGRDDDCDHTADEGTSLYDDDGDGYCDSTVQACTDGSQVGDCNDGSAAVNPGVPEVCSNGVDDNCSGVQDEPGASGCTRYWVDADHDGYGDASTESCACTPPGNAVFNGGDCNDASAAIHPNAPETQDGVDNDCNGAADEGTGAYDNDGDGYCANATCTPQPGGQTFLGNDCNDANTAIHPGAQERCGNNVDDDCNNQQDEGQDALGCVDYYRDGDSDGYGFGAPRCYCNATGAFVTTTPGDCYDGNAQAHPGQTLFFENDRGDGNFDYDCNGTPDARWPDAAICECIFQFGPIPITIDSFEAGWVNRVPACGNTASWYTFCEAIDVSSGGFQTCIGAGFTITGTTQSRVQKCR
ncbi:MAG: hypothetical protein H6733_07505 [Alphaproteobacteria bacterium]|nr:hypothetical protein [Alphaproteobacteria bacterium]